MRFYRADVPIEVMDAILLAWLCIVILIGAAMLWFNQRPGSSKKQRLPPVKHANGNTRKARKRRS